MTRGPLPYWRGCARRTSAIARESRRLRAGASDHSSGELLPVIDLHCHLLPGVDDGATDLPTALAMGELLVAAGFTHVASSPHSGEGPGGDVAPAAAEQARIALQEYFRQSGLPLTLLANAEHHVSPLLFDRIARGGVVPIGGSNNWLLVELPWQWMPNVDGVLFQLQLRGYHVLLAHPERYGFLDVKALRPLAERGVKLQLELGSFVGRYGSRAASRAQRLVQEGVAHVLATDLHRPQTWLGDALAEVARCFGDDALQRACATNPQAILNGCDGDAVLPFG